MATAVQKITLSASRDIPFNKLVLSQSNVRRVKAGVSIEELAEDIARRTLLQSLNVRAVLDAEGKETGMFEIPAGGRRYRALELLVKQKRLAKTAPVPCVVREGGIAEEDSLAENVQRVALHPLDQFRAFQALRDKGLGEEEIAARFFVSPTVVKQRLRLAAVSEKLLEVYAEDGMTLEQLMAFTVNGDHARQEQVWEGLSPSHNREPYYIRRQLTDGAVRASDRRARFVGVEAYEAAGGMVMRDLFQHDEGGWLQDPALLDRLAIEKLQTEAEALQAEGWKWISVAPDFPYGHTAGLRRLVGATVELTEDERASFDALQAENEALEAQYARADELPDEIDQRLGEIETALAAFDNRPVTYEQAEIARAGAFVSIDDEGALRVERGFVRPEDEAPVESVTGGESDTPRIAGPDNVVQGTVITIGGAQNSDGDTSEEDDAIRPLSDRLVTELTADRTLALRDALANEPNVAFQAVLHALCLSAFYRASNSCLEITAKNSGFSAQAPGLAETASARAIDARHEQWATRLPENPADLWDALTAFEHENKAALFAHCAALTVNVVKEPWNRRPDAFAHGDQLARAVDLDMAAAGWRPTVENYLGRVPKVRIIEAVREAKGEHSARLIEHLKKADMAREAERLLDGAGWLPEPLRVAQTGMEADAPTAEVGEAEALPDFLGEDEDDAQLEAEEEQPHAAAAAE
ncbi:ParB/RepB/Spo0J family partition protein [Methylocystis heyeri]|uniref:DNA-binding protein n=1 Tax=Methylocystis heyeri TaxID=391905 RepID=A0A6B8KKT2_9HYPH|nr:ParB/RepB/Spo0J family partition protein [Methylocystis heyeri]QGM48247.1 DNA-binding protein [Methylocystis heyeri]